MEKGGVAQEVSAFEGDGIGHRGVDAEGEIATYFFEVFLAENVPVSCGCGWCEQYFPESQERGGGEKCGRENMDICGWPRTWT